MPERPSRFRRITARGPKPPPADGAEPVISQEVKDFARTMLRKHATRIHEVGPALAAFLNSRIDAEQKEKGGPELFAQAIACLIVALRTLHGVMGMEQEVIAEFVVLAATVATDQGETKKIIRKLEEQHARGERIDLPEGLVFDAQGRIQVAPEESGESSKESGESST